MTKILNLDKIETKREKAIILGGVEHVMKTFTVKEYIYHMKEAAKLSKLDENNIDSLDQGLAATVSILMNAFPTVTKEQFDALTMDQLDAIRELVDDQTEEDLGQEPEGEAEAVESPA